MIWESWFFVLTCFSFVLLLVGGHSGFLRVFTVVPLLLWGLLLFYCCFGGLRGCRQGVDCGLRLSYYFSTVVRGGVILEVGGHLSLYVVAQRPPFRP